MSSYKIIIQTHPFVLFLTVKFAQQSRTLKPYDKTH